MKTEKLVAFFPAYPTWPIATLEYDFIISKINSVREIHYYRCIGESSFCPSNSFFLKNIKIKKKCNNCISYGNNIKKIEKLSSNKLKIIDLKITNQDKKYINNIATNVSSLLDNEKSKEILIKYLESIDKNLYDSVISTMITRLSCESPNIYLHKILFTSILKSFLEYDSMAKNISNSFKYKEVYIFNGRQSRYRSVLNHFKKDRSCDVYTYEYPIISNKNLLIVKDNYGHDHLNFSNQLYNFYIKEVQISDKELDWAEKYFDLRFKGVKSSIDGSYVKKQKYGYLSKDLIETNVKIISYFYSSQFDLANIREKIESSELSQIEIIETLAKEFPDYKIAIRMHPNMKYYQNFYLNNSIFKKYKNIIVIKPHSKISSYELIKVSEVIVTFGSTIGCEAAFLEKFNILVGSAPYMAFGVSTVVKNKSQLINEIENYLKNTITYDLKKIQRNAINYVVTLKKFGHVIKNSNENIFSIKYKISDKKIYIIKYKFWRILNTNLLIDFIHKISIKYIRFMAKKHSHVQCK